MRARTLRSRPVRATVPVLACVVLSALLVTLLAAGGDAHAVTLTVSNVENVQPGAAGVAVPLHLSNDGAAASVGGVQADVSYAAAVLTLTTVKSGTASQDAGKSVSFNIVSDGVVRVIIAGLNQETIQDGALASLVFKVASDARADSYPVAMTVAQMVSPNGVQITGSTVPGSVTVVGPTEGENGGEGEGEGEGGNPSGCACGTMAAPHDPGNSGAVILLMAGMVVFCSGAFRREQR